MHKNNTDSINISDIDHFLPYLMISGAKLTKIFDIRVTEMLKMQFYAEKNSIIQCFHVISC